MWCFIWPWLLKLKDNGANVVKLVRKRYSCFCTICTKWSFCPLGCWKTTSIFTARKRSLGQGNIFKSVCQEFCPQGGLPQCMLGYHPPTEQAPPPGNRHPSGPGTPSEQAPPPGPGTPWEQALPPGPGTPRDQAPPRAEHAGRYGQQATSGRYASYWNAILLIFSTVEVSVFCELIFPQRPFNGRWRKPAKCVRYHKHFTCSVIPPVVEEGWSYSLNKTTTWPVYYYPSTSPPPYYKLRDFY